jgi:multidrug efflux pump subunit AcrB
MPNWDTTASASSHTTLKFRITFYVMSILILLAGIGGYVIRPKDVLPEVDIPDITAVRTYAGMDTPEMDKRVTAYSAFALSNKVNGIRHHDADLLPAGCQHRPRTLPGHRRHQLGSRRAAPPGINPPIVIRFSASTIPVIQLALSSAGDSRRAWRNHNLDAIAEAARGADAMPPTPSWLYAMRT